VLAPSSTAWYAQAQYEQTVTGGPWGAVAFETDTSSIGQAVQVEPIEPVFKVPGT
jgi:hypothetical protein